MNGLPFKIDFDSDEAEPPYTLYFDPHLTPEAHELIEKFTIAAQKEFGWGREEARTRAWLEISRVLKEAREKRSAEREA